MFFAALPWVLAGGFLGPLVSSTLAVLSGILIGLYGSHNPFYPLEIALLGACMGAMLRQRFRTRFFAVLRQPLPAAFILALGYPVLSMLSAVAFATGNLVARLDYAISNLPATSVAIGVELLIAGIFAQVLSLFELRGWGEQGQLIPAPPERSLEARILYSIIPIAAILMALLMAGNWFVAGGAARQMLEDRMANVAGTAAENIPFFLEAGQDLIIQIADDARLQDNSEQEIGNALAENLRTLPFFSQLYLLDIRGKLISGFPDASYDPSDAPLDETLGFQNALNGVRVQSYAIPPEKGGKAARVSFMATLLDASGSVQSVLIGRSDLSTNPFTQPVIAGLDSVNQTGGQGFLLDENMQVLYHPSSEMLMTKYPYLLSEEQSFSDETAPDGTRQLVYQKVALGRPWVIALWMPAQRSQQLSLQIAAPLLAMILLLFALTVLFLRWSLYGVTSSLSALTNEANRLAQGHLDLPLKTDGIDEVGKLRQSFEEMRQKLKARLDELNQLLVVSQGVASTLEFEEAVRPILQSALSSGANVARIVLIPSAMPGVEPELQTIPTRLGAGNASDQLTYLDDQILALTKNQDQIAITNPTRVRFLQFRPGEARPQALLAVSLKHENKYYGSFWIGYESPHQFTEEETRFITTLAGQAALAASNARLFLSAEAGRQRLAAILDSTSDPVLVTDHRNHLLFANPAALQVLDFKGDAGDGRDVTGLIEQQELLNLLVSPSDEKQSAEVTMSDERIYLAISSAIALGGQRIGRVCILRDITYFKELDALKSEFVSTVSHDLRSPLTLIRGYATMLQMVGELNDQQQNYVRKILGGIENMARLVNNLLDLGRIEAGVGLQLEIVPVMDIMDQVSNSMQLQAAQKQIDLVVGSERAGNPMIQADQALLQQALQNLVENAIKYTDAGGRVEIKYEVRQENILLSVRDTGIGIAPVDQSRLFEKFYRVARRGALQQRGTGLGLAIVKSIAERHGGRVWLESQLGKGSTFYIMIPLRQSKKTEEIARDYSKKT